MLFNVFLTNMEVWSVTFFNGKELSGMFVNVVCKLFIITLISAVLGMEKIAIIILAKNQA